MDSFKRGIPWKVETHFRHIYGCTGWPKLWHVHDHNFVFEQSKHFRNSLSLNRHRARIFYNVAIVFVWREELEQKFSSSLLPPCQYGPLWPLIVVFNPSKRNKNLLAVCDISSTYFSFRVLHAVYRSKLIFFINWNFFFVFRF